MIFGHSATGPIIRDDDLPMLLSVYGFGFAGVYLAFNFALRACVAVT